MGQRGTSSPVYPIAGALAADGILLPSQHGKTIAACQRRASLQKRLWPLLCPISCPPWARKHSPGLPAQPSFRFVNLSVIYLGHNHLTGLQNSRGFTLAIDL